MRKLGEQWVEEIDGKMHMLKAYLTEVADIFGITPDKPFCGTFYYERAIIGETGKD